ncbi:MAG: tetratricopeptide repeat protein, partial [Planctomycetes bacterium]|nr:tetratricopeptide repeat protein [Planctomycetota bacterium]
AAAALHKAGKYAPSEEICGRFLEKPAADLLPQALFISGENRFLLKNPAGAAERFKPLVEKYPDAPEAPAARLRLAWIDYGAKNYDGALAHIERIDLKKADKAVQAEAEYLRGNCLLEKKDHERAAEALGRYLSAPDAARYREDALLKLATALARAGKPGDAATRLQQLLKDHGGSPLAAEAEYNLADLLAGPLKKPDEAAAHYKALAERFPDHRLAPYALMGLGSVRLQKGENEPAAEAFARAAEKYPRSDLVPQALYQKGVALEKAGKAAEARAAWQALVEKFPQHDLAPAATLGMAVALQKEKKFDEAAAAFRKLAAGTKDPRTREQASYELAWCLQEAGKTKEAAQAWKSLADKYPGGASAADAAFHLAEAEYANKRYAEAAALFEKSLAAARDGRLKDKALYRLGWCRWSQGDFAGAAAAFDRLVAEAPASDLVPEAILQAGEALTRAGKPAEAINRLKRLLDPKYRPFDRAADARFRLGEAQLILGRNDEAMATLADLEQNWPKYPAMAEVQFNLGKALFDLKRHPEARARFEKALQGADTETAAKAQFYVGEALLAAGDPREALKAYLRVVALWSAYREWAGAAQFESGKCYQALGKPAEAREAFKTVVDKYNDTKWADPAREQLKK